jgi:Chaperone of endosialidase
MRKLPVIIYSIAGCFTILTSAYAATQTLSTYYPAPQGNYKNMTVNNVLTMQNNAAACVASASNPVEILNDAGVLDLCSTNGISYLSAQPFSVAGAFTCSGLLTAGGGITMTGTFTAGGLSIVSSSGNLTTSGALSVANGITMTGGTFTAGGLTITESSGNLTTSGALSVANGITMTGGTFTAGGLSIVESTGILTTSGGIKLTGGSLTAGVLTISEGTGSLTTTGSLSANNLTLSGMITASSGTLEVSGNLYATGNIWALSDERLKQNFMPLANTLSMIDQLHGVSFEWNHLSAAIGQKEGERSIGLIAQEMQKVYPELVGTVKKGDQAYLAIDYSKFTAVLLQAVKELRSQEKDMQAQIDSLQARVKALEKQK